MLHTCCVTLTAEGLSRKQGSNNNNNMDISVVHDPQPNLWHNALCLQKLLLVSLHLCPQVAQV